MENIDIDIDKAILKISIDRAVLEIIDIDIDLAVLENIDIDKEILENIDIDKEISENIDKISYRLEFGIWNRARSGAGLDLNIEPHGVPLKITCSQRSFD